MIEETQPETTGMAWLRFWLAASDWTPEEAAQVLVGIVPRLGGNVFFPGLEPPGTIYGEDGEPPAVTAVEMLLRPEAYRQTEAGPSALRELWLRQQADRISRIALRIDPAKLERPAALVSWALARGIVPPWLEHARADRDLAVLLPVESASPAANQPVRPASLSNQEECWPNLRARLPRSGQGRGGSSKSRRASYPYWSHMIAFGYIHSHKSPEEVHKLLTNIEELSLSPNGNFSAKRIESWREKYNSKVDVALAILKWRLDGAELRRPHTDLPDLDEILKEGEREAESP